MKFSSDLDWVLAIDELQGDIPDPSSFRPVDRGEPGKTNSQSATSGKGQSMVTLSLSGYSTKPSYRASRRSHNGSGSIKF